MCECMWQFQRTTTCVFVQIGDSAGGLKTHWQMSLCIWLQAYGSGHMSPGIWHRAYGSRHVGPGI